jgi:hypothetical protein
VQKSAVDLFLTEASLGCLMAVLSPSDAAPIVAWAHENICPECLAGDGYEASAHVTLLYGFQPQVTEDRVQAALQSWGRQQVRFTLGAISRFDTSPEHDVLKVDIAWADDLRSLNAHLMATFPGEVTQTHPEYNPHLTLAYLQKGACRELDGHGQWQDNTYVLNHLIYSLPESKRKFPLLLR